MALPEHFDMSATLSSTAADEGQSTQNTDKTKYRLCRAPAIAKAIHLGESVQTPPLVSEKLEVYRFCTRQYAIHLIRLCVQVNSPTVTESKQATNHD